MKIFSTANVAGVGVLFLTLGAAPGAMPDQNATQSSTKQPSAESSIQVPSSDQDCQNLKNLTIDAEQMAAQARILQQEMQKFGDLKDRLKWEGEMSSPQMQKLQVLAQQYAKDSDLRANAEALAAQAKDLAVLAQQEQSQDKVEPLFNQNKNFFFETDDGGGWLGVDIDEVTPDNAKDLKLSAVRGVVVKEVEPDSPAAKAGLKENDVVTQYDGQTVEGTVQFRRLVRETPPGHTVALTVSRDGSTQNLSIELGNRQALMQKRLQGSMRDLGNLGNLRTFVTPSMDWNSGNGDNNFAFFDGRTPTLGVNAEDLTGQLGDYFGAPDGQGILVREVRSGTPAEKAGLKAGDVIVSLDGKPVHMLSELREQLRDKSDQKPVNVGILRKGASMSVPVTIEKPRPMELLQGMHRAQL
jgi:serine protease Do